ncbi:MAG TPA: thiol peroxidase [Treponemataceae bacterium]|nr:thiol peroxidase [Treponemataceae bacterium]
MADITFKGSPFRTKGNLPAVGSKAPDFRLTKKDLSDVSLADFAGFKKIVNIVPSLDTGVCAASARRFDAEVQKLENVVILTVSCDLPFAQNRFCSAEGLTRVITLSQMRNKAFGATWGVEMVDGPLAGILSRAIVVLDSSDTVTYTEQVTEITSEPGYAAALQAVQRAK